MLGFTDPQIMLAYVLSILATGLCVAYGIKNWNSDS
ncbi:symporter small accessory protein [Desulforamulus aeronauticus]